MPAIKAFKPSVFIRRLSLLAAMKLRLLSWKPFDLFWAAYRITNFTSQHLISVSALKNPIPTGGSF